MTTPQPLSGSEARHAPRASLYLTASLQDDGRWINAKIRNISQTGALIELSNPPRPGAVVQLVRGSLVANASVAWQSGDRCGLRFAGRIDVQQWRASPANAEQQRVDEILKLVRSGAVPLPGATAGCVTGSDRSLSSDLRLASDLLGKLGEALARDDRVVSDFADALQNLDIAAQVIGAVRAVLGGQTDLSMDVAKIENLRRSAAQALSRP